MFTQFQKEEILALLEVRLQTIQEDKSSADDFETEDSLNVLKSKIETADNSYTQQEIEWMIGEFAMRIQVASEYSMSHEINIRKAHISSLKQAINKLTTKN